MKWKNLLEEFIGDYSSITLNPPATEQQISEIEEKLHINLPADIKDILGEFNGDNFFLLSAEQMIKINLMVRTFNFCMPLDCLLFFGENGCGDYYGYPITREDGIRSDNVFMWNHEYDSREWKATSLQEAIEKYYSNLI